MKAGSSILSIEGIDCIMQRSWAELTLEDPDTLVEEVGPWQRRPMRCDRCPAAPILGPQDAPSDPPLLELIPSLGTDAQLGFCAGHPAKSNPSRNHRSLCRFGASRAAEVVAIGNQQFHGLAAGARHNNCVCNCKAGRRACNGSVGCIGWSGRRLFCCMAWRYRWTEPSSMSVGRLLSVQTCTVR